MIKNVTKSVLLYTVTFGKKNLQIEDREKKEEDKLKQQLLGKK